MKTKKTDDRFAACYVRVSKTSQDVRSQLPDLKRWAASQDVPVKFYTDKYTGRTLQRPALSRLLGDVRSGKVRSITVWRLDRLGRSVVQLASLFVELQELRTNLISIKDSLNLETAGGRLLAHILISAAAYENEVRMERVRAGMDAAREAGVHLGRPPGIRTRIKVTKEQEGVMLRMRHEGAGTVEIARATGLSRKTVYRFFKV